MIVVNLGPFIVEGDRGRHIEGAFAFLDLVARFDGLARDNIPPQCFGNHFAQPGDAHVLIG